MKVTRAACPYAALLLIAACLAPAQTMVPPGSYVVTQIATNAHSSAINNFGQVVGSGAGSAFLWTPVTANGTAGSLTDLGGLAVAGAPVNSAAGINDRGQVVGNTAIQSTTSVAPFLWSPGYPNGTSGTITAFAGAVPLNQYLSARGINAYGQIFGLGGGTYLWTPSTPNGTFGTFDWDNRLQYIYAINDYGQAAINTLGSAVHDLVLFTPSVANSTAGSFAEIPGLPGATSQSIAAINQNGTVLGGSCLPGTGNCTGFLWTPSSPNGSVGTTSAIPLPAGFASMSTIGLNASGQVVGDLWPASGTGTPFLYSGGTVYDLSTVSGQLAGGYATGINNRGQIVVDANLAVYLLTPSAPSTSLPGEVPITIASDPPGRMFQVTGNGCHPGGYTAPQTLGWLPGSACTVAFVSPHSSQIGTRYLFSAWQDGQSLNPRTITAPAQATTYTGSFATQYSVTALTNLPGAGTVSGGGWYFAGTPATLSATAAPGYQLVDWSGVPDPSPGFGTITVNVTAPLTVTANFSPPTTRPPGSYTVSLIANSASAAQGKPINNFGQIVGTLSASPPASSGFLWTPATANAATGSLVDLPLGISGINDRGQAVGGSSSGQAALWSPTVPNGQSGAVTEFLGSPGASYSDALGINSFGQIIGQGAYNYFLWTPSIANGTSGNFVTTLPGGSVAINDFGQVVGGYISATLFTPSTPNGSVGTSTVISNIGTAVAINNSGTILGADCPAYGSGCIHSNGYLWTPASPNGTVGTVAQIPLPPGFVSVRPTALNNKGDVVGILTLGNGAVVPFLYTAGSMYDLSALNSQLRGGIAGGINDRGQIVITTGGLPFNVESAVYLLSPSALAPAAVNPASGSGSNQLMVFTFSDSAGWQDLDVVNILINTSLDGRNACYLAYSRFSNTLYLVNDAGTALLPGLPLSGAGGVSNAQCGVTGAGSSASGSGSVLTLTLNLSFNPSFAGNQIVYLAARDLAQDNSGWQPLGTWTVPGASSTSPAVAGVSPVQGSGSTQTFTFAFSDNKGWQDLGVVDILINNFLDGRQACYLAYSRPLNVLYLVNDLGTGLLPALVLNGSGAASNSQCAVTSSGSSVAQIANTLILTLSLTFSSSFSGNRIIYSAARDYLDANTSGWQAVGVWSVP